MASVLIPGMTQVNYAALVASSITNEGYVNGIWNSILHEIFATRAGLWTISPEVAMGAGYADFLVNRNTYGAQLTKIYTVLFEGKNRTGATFPNILSQLVGYTNGLPVGKVVYLIGARGQQCAFWRFTKRPNPINEVEQMFVQGGVVHFTITTAEKVYDIVTQGANGQDSIATMLAYIRTYPPALADELLEDSAEVNLKGIGVSDD